MNYAFGALCNTDLRYVSFLQSTLLAPKSKDWQCRAAEASSNKIALQALGWGRGPPLGRLLLSSTLLLYQHTACRRTGWLALRRG